VPPVSTLPITVCPRSPLFFITLWPRSPLFLLQCASGLRSSFYIAPPSPLFLLHCAPVSTLPITVCLLPPLFLLHCGPSLHSSYYSLFVPGLHSSCYIVPLVSTLPITLCLRSPLFILQCVPGLHSPYYIVSPVLLHCAPCLHSFYYSVPQFPLFQLHCAPCLQSSYYTPLLQLQCFTVSTLPVKWCPLQSRQSAKLFHQSSELGLSQPLTRKLVCPPPPFGSGEGHTRWRERGWESPNSNEGTCTVVWYYLNIYTLWCPCSPLFLLQCTPVQFPNSKVQFWPT
jgi:hypothetical protein